MLAALLFHILGLGSNFAVSTEWSFLPAVAMTTFLVLYLQVLSLAPKLKVPRTCGTASVHRYTQLCTVVRCAFCAPQMISPPTTARGEKRLPIIPPYFRNNSSITPLELLYNSSFQYSLHHTTGGRGGGGGRGGRGGANTFGCPDYSPPDYFSQSSPLIRFI